MKTAIKEIQGNWDRGFVLDKHSVSSVPSGVNAGGYTAFKTIRTEVGEALFQLKYRGDWAQVQPLAAELATTICPLFPDFGLIIPMAASNARARQPVTEIATATGAILNKPCFGNLLIKTPNGKSLKNLTSKAEKIEALKDTLSINDEITNDGRWNALLVDDLYHTGASLEAACAALKTYPKIAQIYVAVLTWR